MAPRLVPSVLTADQFERQLDALTSEITGSRDHFNLWRDLRDTFNEDATAYDASPAFWSLTFHGHRKLCLYELARIFDRRDDSLNLQRWLRGIKGSLYLFAPVQRRARLAANQYVDSLMADYRPPSHADLDADLAYFVPSDPVVGRLIALRDQSFAHHSLWHATHGTHVTGEVPFGEDEIELLFDRALGALNKYSLLYYAQAVPTSVVGRKDYQQVIKAVTKTRVG